MDVEIHELVKWVENEGLKISRNSKTKWINKVNDEYKIVNNY